MGAPQLLVESWEIVEQAANYVCLKHHLYGDDRDEFLQELRLHILKDDGAVLARFRGQSSFRTYVTAVVVHFLYDFRERLWGNWRHSAVATRLGSTAKHLEVLIVRDQLTLDEACEVLWSRGVRASRAELDQFAAQFPARSGARRALPIDSVPEQEGKDRPDGGLELDEAVRQAQAIRAALRAALQELPHRERLAVQLRFYDSKTLAWIADHLGMERKRFYRWFEEVLASLGKSLQIGGLTAAEVGSALSDGFPDLESES